MPKAIGKHGICMVELILTLLMLKKPYTMGIKLIL